MSSSLLVYSVWILLPILPAFVMFKFLPSDATGTGAFDRMKWKLGGAFAGYFAILLLSRGFVPLLMAQEEETEKWVITGTINMEGGTENPKLATLLVHPPGPVVDETGHFSLEIFRPRTNGGPKDDPHLVVMYSGYQPQGIALTATAATTNIAYGVPLTEVEVIKDDRRINIKTPISLKKVLPALYTPRVANTP